MNSERVIDKGPNDHDKSSWNALRLVKEYMKVAWMTNDTIPYKDIPLSNQIRLQRVASVVCAYLGETYNVEETIEIINRVFDCYENRMLLEHSSIDEENLTHLKQMLCECSEDGWKIEHLLKKFDIKKDRGQLMRMLIRFRIGTEDLLEMFSGVIEARVGGYIGIQTVRALYNPVINENNDKVDEMLAILLGNKFSQTFTERELIENYNYPLMSDKELLDLEIENY